jgi:hypothetical protein
MLGEFEYLILAAAAALADKAYGAAIRAAIEAATGRATAPSERSTPPSTGSNPKGYCKAGWAAA